MNIGFYLYNYPVLRRAIAVGLFLFAWVVFNTYTDLWKVRNELTQNGVTVRAGVTGRSYQYLRHDDEDGDMYQYETKYEYTAGGSGELIATYSGESGNYDTYQNAEAGWIQVIYSSRNPSVSLPSGEFTPAGSFLAWAVTHWFEYLMALGFLIASLWTDIIDLRNLWNALRQGWKSRHAEGTIAHSA